jgi:hypothetical protein
MMLDQFARAFRSWLKTPRLTLAIVACIAVSIAGASTIPSLLVVVTPGGAERLLGEVVTPGYFRLLGLAPQRGRVFTDDEYEGRGERAILFSSDLWRSRFASREASLSPGRPSV